VGEYRFSCPTCCGGSSSSGSPQQCCGSRALGDLVATINNTVGCACADSTQIDLVYQGENETGVFWSGSGSFGSCGQTITMELRCVANGPCAFELDVSIQTCGAGFTNVSPASCVCDADNPPVITFGSMVVVGCCGGFPPEEINIVITE